MTPVEIVRGDSPLVLAMPHTGLHVPDDIWDGLNETGKALADTDWNIHRLYDDLVDNVTTVRATFHRYVIDANRDPSGASLYPGQNTTGLCPLTDFDGDSLYQGGREPDAADIEGRRLAFHVPYHAALKTELERVRATHGVAILYDCHSIRSQVPFLFDGTLPDFNIGTNGGVTCAPQIEDSVVKTCSEAKGYSVILNGRFKGGWTTRHYGRPADGFHAIQMELAQSVYMDEAAPWTYRPDLADRLRPYLKTILKELGALARELSDARNL